MNRFYILSLICFLGFSLEGRAQEIKVLVPWSSAPVGAEMGMSAQDLKAILPDIRPLFGMSDDNQPDESETPKDGMYASRSSEGDYSEAMAYGINGGRVTQVYWSSKKMASLADVKSFRKKLSKMHGEPRLGHKAKVTKDGIAKITTEVFTLEDTGLSISLSSALGETEIAILDTNDPDIDLNELYFSFEKQRDRLQQELLRLTKKAPKDEIDADCLDVLREAISSQVQEPASELSKQGSDSRDIAPAVYPNDNVKVKELIKGKTSENSEASNRIFVFVVITILVFACGLFFFWRRSSRN